MERSLVQYETTAIPYAIQRSSRRKTVSIAIDPEQGVIVTAPAAAPVAKLDDIVHRKAAWITERLRRTSSSPPPPPGREYVSGESFEYLGRHYRLKVQPGAVQRPDVRLLRGWLTVTIPVGLDGMDGPSRVRMLRRSIFLRPEPGSFSGDSTIGTFARLKAR